MNLSQTDAQVVNSARWAAYGDAFGFITELTDEAGLFHRTGCSYIERLVPWRRTVGGRFGASVTLPFGCYSDDTQLRLATSRAIRGDGAFDVEAFAKIELPVWLSYSLGAGKGSKLAASNLIKKDVNWFSNFYKRKGGDYFQAGGNGAAMRIQPHVWMNLSSLDCKATVKDVVRNSIVTHGHVNGILGAVFHSLVLRDAFVYKSVPGPENWKKTIRGMRGVPDLLKEDSELSSFWLPVWEGEVGRSFKESVHAACDELVDLFSLVEDVIGYESLEDAQWYYDILNIFGGLDAKTRGSGIGTASVAAVLSWCFKDKSIGIAIEKAANVLGSDTDSIATMAGAILGGVKNEEPPQSTMDDRYIIYEARRLANIGSGNLEDSFTYPDLAGWLPPRTQLDALGEMNDSLYISGLGAVEPIGNAVQGRSKGGELWQWYKLYFGQKILVKRRSVLSNASLSNVVINHEGLSALTVDADSSQRDLLSGVSDGDLKVDDDTSKDMASSVTSELRGEEEVESVASERTIDSISSEAIRSGFDPGVIGKHILELVDRKGSVEDVIAYSAIVAKARISRNRKSGS